MYCIYISIYCFQFTLAFFFNFLFNFFNFLFLFSKINWGALSATSLMVQSESTPSCKPFRDKRRLHKAQIAKKNAQIAKKNEKKYIINRTWISRKALKDESFKQYLMISQLCSWISIFGESSTFDVSWQIWQYNSHIDNHYSLQLFDCNI